MLLEDVISSFPIETADAVAIGYRASDDVDWELVWVNDAFCMMFGTDHVDAIGRHPDEIHHPDYLADFLEHVEEMNAAGRSYLTIGSRCHGDNGSEFWASISLFMIRDKDGTGKHGVLNIRDIDDLKDREQAAELALIENEQLLFKVEAAQTRLISAIETTSDPFAIYDRRDKLVIWNPAYASTLTDEPSDIKKGMKLSDIMLVAAKNGRFPEALGHEERWVRETLASWRENTAAEHRLTTGQGEYKVVLTHASNGDKVLLQLDISEFLKQERDLKRYAERLEHSNQEFSYQALHDELTGLGNRRFLNLKLEELRQSRRKNGGEIAALNMDLDRFKQINDTMGHAVGDHVLQVVADRLRNTLRSDDIIVRTGGDEFIILMKCEAHSDMPVVVAGRLIEEMTKPVTFDGRPCDFGASIGVAQSPLSDPNELLTSSDIALYKAKDAGRGCVGVFDEGDLQQLRANRDLGADIKRGLECGEFVPAFLPETEPGSGKTLGYEVLVRWQHPQRGLLMPAVFLEAAQDIQVIDQIDKAVFEKTMELCKATFSGTEDWPNLSFNVSHPRVLNEDLAGEIAFWDYPGRISLELPEDVILKDESIGLARSLKALRDAGVGIVVDDFGSGAASLVALRRVAPDALKIDARLVEPIIQSSTARNLVQSIVDLGRALKIAVIAEGVETEEHAKALIELGCGSAQGFYFGKPKLLEAVLKDRIGKRDKKSA